jgi:hypothetical protein
VLQGSAHYGDVTLHCKTLGSYLATQGDLTLKAGRDLAAQAARVESAQGTIAAFAGRDLALAEGRRTDLDSPTAPAVTCLSGRNG